MPKKYLDELKREVIRRHEQGKSIKAISQEFHLAQSTIYRWTKELCSIETSVRKYTPAEFDKLFRRADRSGREKEQAELMLKVQQIFDDSSQRYGAEKIRIVLTDSGIRVSMRRIAAIMKELDLQSVRPEAKQQFKKRQQEQRKNWLERSFTAQHPNQT